MDHVEDHRSTALEPPWPTRPPAWATWLVLPLRWTALAILWATWTWRRGAVLVLVWAALAALLWWRSTT